MILRHIELIERDHHRDAELTHLAREEQVALEMAGIDHDQHHMRTPVLAIAVEEHFECDLFVGRAGRERIRAREIEHGDATTVVHAERAFDALHSDTREVADALAQARERVEQRRLACIGVADDGNAQWLGGGAPLRACSSGHVSARRDPAVGP